MISRGSLPSAIVAVCVAAMALAGPSAAFTARSVRSRAALASARSGTSLNQWGGRKEPEEDLSFIESRDLTREEMLEINRRNEQVMNNELWAMTGISVLFSLPVFYLCWVAFFSD